MVKQRLKPSRGKTNSDNCCVCIIRFPAYLAEEWIKLGGPAGGLGYDIRMDRPIRMSCTSPIPLRASLRALMEENMGSFQHRHRTHARSRLAGVFGNH